ncbi:Hypothetical predicted protein [Paramuricea clavata]|uniref:Uncharacterized protein n=1 Tax=Paramuricea clavata TaxID=317549 RepID=A0A7D9I3H2_PARCT|nr:Hypothetical predicted protein [Paramuricea clavata]
MMAARHVLAIFALAGMFVLSMQYPAYEEKDRAEKMAFLRDYIKYLQMRDQHENVVKRGCIQLGEFGCEGNNANCCRSGGKYTGTMRRCVNVGLSFSAPEYQCQEN